MKTYLLKVLSLSLICSGLSFASGYICNSESTANGKWVVKLFNHTHVDTRVPAVLVVANEKDRTVLRRFDDEIEKVNRRNTVQYVVEGNRKSDADLVIFQVAHKEGRETLREGQEVKGQLILVREDDKDVIELVCTRYLKN